MKKIEKKYKFTTVDSVESLCIQLIGGKWDGFVYHYGVVQPIEDGEELIVNFEYVPIQLPKGMKEINATPKFQKLLGDILTHIIETQSIETIGANISDGRDTREFDTPIAD